jgi:putative transposase
VGRARQEVETGISHVYARGNRRQALFLDDRDRRTYLAMLGVVVRRYRWRCLSFCLMTNHVHLLIETTELNLGVGMQRFHGPYAQTFNRRHDKDGHLFQRRYDSVRIGSDAQLVTTLRYIARNPVEAGACENAEDWPWSSHALLVARRPPPWLDSARVSEYLAAMGTNINGTVPFM